MRITQNAYGVYYCHYYYYCYNKEFCSCCRTIKIAYTEQQEGPTVPNAKRILKRRRRRRTNAGGGGGGRKMGGQKKAAAETLSARRPTRRDIYTRAAFFNSAPGQTHRRTTRCHVVAPRTTPPPVVYRAFPLRCTVTAAEDTWSGPVFDD